MCQLPTGVVQEQSASPLTFQNYWTKGMNNSCRESVRCHLRCKQKRKPKQEAQEAHEEGTETGKEVTQGSLNQEDVRQPK